MANHWVDQDKYTDPNSSDCGDFKAFLKEILHISDDFATASDHPRECRCDKCLGWWVDMTEGEEGEDLEDAMTDCPFSAEELETARQKRS